MAAHRECKLYALGLPEAAVVYLAAIRRAGWKRCLAAFKHTFIPTAHVVVVNKLVGSPAQPEHNVKSFPAGSIIILVCAHGDCS